MSERTDLVADSPQVSLPSADDAARGRSASSADELRSLIAALEREAKALGDDPMAAVLFQYVGRLWEQELRNLRNAAVAYQNAFKVAPQFLENMRSARRLFSEVGNWSMSLQLLDSELSVQQGTSRRAVLLAEKAAILGERLSRDAEAMAVYEQCLALEPLDISLLCQLESVFSAKGKWDALVRVYELLANALKDEPVRAQCLSTAGFIVLSRLSDEGKAAELFRAALPLDRSDAALVSALVQTAEKQGDVERLLSALQAQIDLEGPRAASTFLRMSKIYGRLKRNDDAIATLLAARRITPRDPLILAELARIYEGQKQHEELAHVLTERSEIVLDESEFVSINLRLATLYEEALKRDPDAVARYKSILARVPGQSTALAGLGRLHHRNQDWEALLQVYDAEIAAASDSKLQVAKLFKSAEIAQKQLDRIEDATQRYGKCLEIEPGYLPAQKALMRLYEQQGKFLELIAVHEQDLLQATDSAYLISTLTKISRIYEDRLNDSARAIECLRRILESSPEHVPTLQELARLYERTAQWEKYIEVQEMEAALIGDIKQVLKLHHRNAEALEENVGDRNRAILEYEKLLFLSPTYVPALKALGRLYAQDQRWEDLIRMYRAEADLSPSSEQAAELISRIGELYEQRLESLDHAISAYQEVLTLAPNHYRALRALGRIYRAQGAWESLVSVLRAEAAGRADPVERANALYEAAEIWEEQLEKPDTAIEGYEEVLRLTPGHTAATRALERMYSARNDARQVIAVLEREARITDVAEVKIDAQLKVAHWYFDRLGDPIRAAQACESVLSLNGTHLPALKLLERARSLDRTRRLDAQARFADVVKDAALRNVLRLQAVTQNGSIDPGSTAELKSWFFDHPEPSHSSESFERMLEQSNDSNALLEWWDKRRDTLEAPLERLALSLRIATHAEQVLGDEQRALRAYQDALKENPNCTAALRGMGRIATKMGDYAQALEALEREGRAARDRRGALEAFVAAGLLASEKLHDSAKALLNFQNALDINPLEPRANMAAEALLLAQGAKSDACAFFRRRADAKLSAKDSLGAADDLYAAAKILLSDLDDPVEAYRLLGKALAAQPDHVGSLELQGNLALQLGQHQEAVSAYSARIQLGGEPAKIAQLHVSLGGIFHDKLGESSRALAHLQTALAIDNGNIDVLRRLADIHTSSRNWTAACDCLERLMELESGPEDKAAYAVRLAQILDTGLSNTARASSLYRQAYETLPNSKVVMDAYVEFCQRHSKEAELLQLLEKEAAHSERAKAIETKLRIADITARSEGSSQQALQAYRRVLELDPTSVQAQAAIADLLESSAHTSGSAIDEHRRVLSLQLTRLESWHGLFRLWERAHQTDRAFCLAALLTAFGEANTAEKTFYEEQRLRLPSNPDGFLDHQDSQTLLHPSLRGNPLVAILQAIGDQVAKIYPSQHESFGVNRKSDRLATDHPLSRMIAGAARLLTSEEFEIYEADHGVLTLDIGAPLIAYVGPDFARKWSVPERAFLAARAAFGLAFKTAIVVRTSPAELADLIGNSIRIFAPGFGLLGRRNDDATRQLRKLYSRKALKALEAACMTSAKTVDLPATLEGFKFSSERFGAVVCGDPSAAVSVLAREESLSSGGPVSLSDAVSKNAAIRQLLIFSLSEPYFSLRQKAHSGLSTAVATD